MIGSFSIEDMEVPSSLGLQLVGVIDLVSSVGNTRAVMAKGVG